MHMACTRGLFLFLLASAGALDCTTKWVLACDCPLGVISKAGACCSAAYEGLAPERPCGKWSLSCNTADGNGCCCSKDTFSNPQKAFCKTACSPTDNNCDDPTACTPSGPEPVGDHEFTWVGDGVAESETVELASVTSRTSAVLDDVDRRRSSCI